MKILAFETSCDDTSIALFEDDQLIAMDTKSQIETHTKTSWVVPEVAARLHANNIFDVLETVLSKGGARLEDIDVFACTEEPGLIPSLLVGRTVAKTLAASMNRPIVWIDHIQAHMFANLLERKEGAIAFPAICLTVSGGHNEIYIWKSLFERELIGETIDDAAGEAFDKVAKSMGLGFPGGPVISRLASEYTWEFRRILPVPLLSKDSLDFSFSGLKSAVKREIDLLRDPEFGSISESDMRMIAFEFERTVAQILSEKVFRAANRHAIRSVVLSGGVSSNDFLKETIGDRAKREGYSFLAPVSKVYSQDNAAMVGVLAYYKHLYGK